MANPVTSWKPVLAGVFFLSGCASGLIGELPRVDPSAETVQVCFIRAGSAGRGERVAVYVDGKPLVSLHSREYAKFQLPVGVHRIRAVPFLFIYQYEAVGLFYPGRERLLSTDGGRTKYFLVTWPDESAWPTIPLYLITGPWVFSEPTELSREEGEKLMRSSSYVDLGEEDDPLDETTEGGGPR